LNVIRIAIVPVGAARAAARLLLSRWSVVTALLVALTLAVPPAFGQEEPSAAQVLGSTPIQAAQCSGPLGSLLPECHAGKSSLSLQTPAIPLGGVVAGAAGRTGSAGATSAPAAPPAERVEPEPPTEFQRLAASSTGDLRRQAV
jgi:hypothetical protein